MSLSPAPPPFTTPERELIRREFGMHFGSYPSLADGIILRRWRAGPHKGEPKLPAAVQSMLGRGLVEVLGDGPWPRAVFTDAGRLGLIALASSRRFLPPDIVEHLRGELGLGGAAARPA